MKKFLALKQSDRFKAKLTFKWKLPKRMNIIKITKTISL
jgi:hypothetical protein